MNTPTAHLRVAALLAIPLLLTACATTSFKSSWKAPDAGPVDFRSRKVVAMVIHHDDGVRRSAEDVLAAEITKRGAAGIASYTLTPAADLRDATRAKQHLQQAGIEGAVVMRPVSRKEQATYVPGAWSGPTHYRTFYGYYGPGWGGIYSPGYVRTDTYASVETHVYSVTEDKLLWAGTSETMNPARIDSFVKELASAVAEELTRLGLVRSGK